MPSEVMGRVVCVLESPRPYFRVSELCREDVLFVGACVAAEQLPALVHAGEPHAPHHPTGRSRRLPAGHQTLSAGDEAAHDEKR